ncbi:DUF507 family protein [Candidatus Binatia bacterium]|jgi:hypothetical protein|nr:DUF507 family protein [Candidatus Binatia bacterium]
MRLSEALTSHLAHRALEALRKSGAKIRNDRLALAEIKKALGQTLDRDPRIDEAVQRRIASLSRSVPVGSAEYEVLYRQYYEQEMAKRRR